METLTKQILRKLRLKAEKELAPFAGMYRSQGLTEKEIIEKISEIINAKVAHFYAIQKEEKYSLGNILNDLMGGIKPDSKAEVSLYIILEENNIPFEFQYKIGKYRVDYLIAGQIIFEGDGPHHNGKKQKEHDKKRDKYLKSLGYRIIRIPWVWIAQSTDMVIDFIKEEIKGDQNGSTSGKSSRRET